MASSLMKRNRLLTIPFFCFMIGEMSDYNVPFSFASKSGDLIFLLNLQTFYGRKFFL